MDSTRYGIGKDVLAARIRCAYEQRFETQGAFALAVGGTKCQPMASNWCTGKKTPRLSTLKKIAAATGQPLEAFTTRGHSPLDQDGTIADNVDEAKQTEALALLEEAIEGVDMATQNGILRRALRMALGESGGIGRRARLRIKSGAWGRVAGLPEIVAQGLTDMLGVRTPDDGAGALRVACGV